MRAMARRPDGTEQALVELKGVDAAYPLVGRRAAVRRRVARRGDPPRARRGHRPDPARAARPEGRRPPLARHASRCRSAPPSPPSPTSSPSGSPSARACWSRSRRCSAPGSSIRAAWSAGATRSSSTALPGSRTAGSSAFRERVKQALPEGGFTVRDRRDPSPQVSRTLERLRQFLTLVGLTALLVGGVGVANAVATYIDRRRKVIAAFKSLGATSGTILAHPSPAGADDRRHRHRARHRAGLPHPGRR